MNKITQSRRNTKFFISVLAVLFFVVSFYGNVLAKIIEWGGIKAEDIPKTLYIELNEGLEIIEAEKIAKKYNLSEKKRLAGPNPSRNGRSGFLFTVSDEHNGGKEGLLKNLKQEKAIKLAHSVYRNIDVARENVFTYSDLIFVFFNESSSMADIEEAIRKNSLTLVPGIEEDFEEFKAKSKAFRQQLEKDLAKAEDAWEIKRLLILQEEAEKNNYGDIKTFRLKDPKKQDAFAVCAELEALEEVVHAYPNSLSLANDLLVTYPNDTYFGYQSHYLTINCHLGWDVTHGSSFVDIAILDSGVDLGHPDLDGDLITGYNTYSPGDPPWDDLGHGTCVAGLASAETDNSTGVAGVGWDCDIMPVKVLDYQNSIGGEYNVSDGLYYARTNGAEVINMSFRWPGSHNYIDYELYYCFINDVFAVAAVGNGDTDYVDYPARNPYVAAVGAVDAYGDRIITANYGWGSNYGYDDDNDYAVHFMAQGIYLVTTSPTYYISENYPLDYIGNFQGTSGSAPHVAGLAGLLRAIKPNLTNNQTFNCIYNTCYSLGDPYYYGAGLVDVRAALDYAIANY